MALSDLVFSDLFVDISAANSWFKATPDSMTVSPIPPECEAELEDFRQCLLAPSNGSSFRINWPDASGIRLRVQRMDVTGANPIFVCRRFNLAPGPLQSLGIPAAIAEKMLADDMMDGLVVFFGKAGAGKTTTAASFVLSRLEKFGGVAWTIENPAEMLLEGKHGKGWCYQTEAKSDEEIGPAIKNLMRATPNIIFIGELRNQAEVREALAAATSGHLVVATFHAADLQSGLARLARFGGQEQGAASLADALKLAMHLSLHNHAGGQKPVGSSLGGFLSDALSKGTGTPPRILRVEPLWVTGPTADGVRSIIRSGKYVELATPIEQQRRALMSRSA